MTEIRLRPLPSDWQNVLFEIYHLLPQYKFVIAGGAIRDLLLNTQPIKDLDIFVLGADEEAVKRISTEFDEHLDTEYGRRIRSGELKRSSTEDGPYSRGNVWRWPALQPFGDKGPVVDLVAMADVPDVSTLLRGFDINLTQVAHNGNHFTIHENFIEGVEQRVIRVLDAGYPENSRQRVARMQQKLAGFTTDLTILA
jgi:hypothetical protein